MGKHALPYSTELDLRGLSKIEKERISWSANNGGHDLATYLFIHYKYGMHRWLGQTEDLCVVCNLAGTEVSCTLPYYSEYGVREWSE
jgi:hypothetical protein